MVDISHDPYGTHQYSFFCILRGFNVYLCFKQSNIRQKDCQPTLIFETKHQNPNKISFWPES